jgi:hypothetical protein
MFPQDLMLFLQSLMFLALFARSLSSSPSTHLGGTGIRERAFPTAPGILQPFPLGCLLSPTSRGSDSTRVPAILPCSLLHGHCNKNKRFITLYPPISIQHVCGERRGREMRTSCPAPFEQCGGCDVFETLHQCPCSPKK